MNIQVSEKELSDRSLIKPENKLMFKRMDAGHGDKKSIWDVTNPDELEMAQKEFDELTKKGFTAFYVKDDGSKGERMTKFEPKAGTMILVPARKGG
jgi:hypothetical protein